jgi:hypothetical protein
VLRHERADFQVDSPAVLAVIIDEHLHLDRRIFGPQPIGRPRWRRVGSLTVFRPRLLTQNVRGFICFG